MRTVGRNQNPTIAEEKKGAEAIKTADAPSSVEVKEKDKTEKKSAGRKPKDSFNI